MTAPTFRSVRARTVTTVRACIEDGLPTPCRWERGDRQFIPKNIVVEFGDSVMTVRVEGPRVTGNCGCDCHPTRDVDDALYMETYYPSNPGKQPPDWIMEWAQRAMAGAR